MKLKPLLAVNCQKVNKNVKFKKIFVYVNIERFKGVFICIQVHSKRTQRWYLFVNRTTRQNSSAGSDFYYRIVYFLFVTYLYFYN